MVSQRGESIALSIMLALFVIWLIVGAGAQNTSAQVVQPVLQAQNVQLPPSAPAQAASPGSTAQHTQDKSTGELVWSSITGFARAITGRFVDLWPNDASIIAAILAGLGAWLIAHVYTKRLKRIEATLEFSRRFHELIQQQCVLNRKYAEDYRAKTSLPEIEKQEADAWWWRFFDLLLYEFYFWQRGLIRNERFIEWMVWRWHDDHPKRGKKWKTCGVDYKDGWANWRIHPAHGSRLITLLDEIHRIPDKNDKESDKKHEENVKKKVRAIVNRHRPRWWKRWRVA